MGFVLDNRDGNVFYTK